jgi:quaternary ammonium compound-resistance protein SugE
MAWVILVVSGVMEAVWAAALDASDGFTRLAPTMLFLVALAISMVGLAVAMRSIPLGTAYVVWVGVGAVLTVLYAMVFGGEPASVPKLFLIAAIVACVVGLKLLE